MVRFDRRSSVGALDALVVTDALAAGSTVLPGSLGLSSLPSSL